MKCIFKFIFFACSLFLLPFDCLIADPNIVGDYRCTVTDPFDSSVYEADLSISKSESTYKFKWIIQGRTYFGTGIFSRNVKDVIAVSEYWQPIQENNTGIAVYKLQKDGSLDGHWAVTNKGLVGSEICKKYKDSSAYAKPNSRLPYRFANRKSKLF
jgi:hypothetical protein